MHKVVNSTEPQNAKPPVVRLRGITKRFGAVAVLEGVDFDVFPGEVHLLAGENGAGKSTLIKILGGVYSDYRGTIEIAGRAARPTTPREATALGIALIHQELSLVPTMSVADNLFLGRMNTAAGFVRERQQRRDAAALLKRFGIEIDVTRSVGSFSLADQQLVEVAKAVGQEARVLVMDEPTSALRSTEVDRLFRWIDDLKARGCAIVYITHKMEEIERIADRITVLRDGQVVGTGPACEWTQGELIRRMVGRSLDDQFPPHHGRAGEVLMELKDVSVQRGSRRLVDGVSFRVRRGEIVGLAGLQGAGSSDLLGALFDGRSARIFGSVELGGRPYRPGAPARAIRRGVALVTNDRKATGLVLPLSVIANTTLAELKRFSPGGWRIDRRERAATVRMAKSFRLQAPSLDMPVQWLSGGNQQKVALAKWLLTEPKLLLLDEPTRGVDVGAKRDIYQLMNRWTEEGLGILMITSEMSELLAMSDRIVVMHRGRQMAELEGERMTADRVLAAAMGRPSEAVG